MTFTSRPYQDAVDLERMAALTRDAWRDWRPSTHYHIGDLYWRMRNPSFAEELRLWEAAQGRLAGFGEFYNGSTFDFQVHPHYVGSLEPEMLDWAEACAAQSETQQDSARCNYTWANPGEMELIALLEARGYLRQEVHYCTHLRPLYAPVEAAVLPEGYRVRHLRGAEEIEARVEAHRGGWQTQKMTVESYRRLMATSGYRPELDIAAEAPDGSLVACCNVWLDETNRVGEFEPVSTHPDHRQKGLGKGIILFGLQQMQRYGMRTGFVVSWHESTPARRLYESCGLEVARREYRYIKHL